MAQILAFAAVIHKPGQFIGVDDDFRPGGLPRPYISSFQASDKVRRQIALGDIYDYKHIVAFRIFACGDIHEYYRVYIVLYYAFYLPAYFAVEGYAGKRRFGLIVFVFYAYYHRAAHGIGESRNGFGEFFIIFRQHIFIVEQGVFRHALL